MGSTLFHCVTMYACDRQTGKLTDRNFNCRPQYLICLWRAAWMKKEPENAQLLANSTEVAREQGTYKYSLSQQCGDVIISTISMVMAL